MPLDGRQLAVGLVNRVAWHSPNGMLLSPYPRDPHCCNRVTGGVASLTGAPCYTDRCPPLRRLPSSVSSPLPSGKEQAFASPHGVGLSGWTSRPGGEASRRELSDRKQPFGLDAS